MNTFLKENDIWALSITGTGKCNCNCAYCHFYASRNRKQYNYDMPFELFSNYCKLIKHIREKYHKKLQVRFSGGEPLMMGDKLFEYSKYLHNVTGLGSYVLTNGRMLSSQIIEKSKKSFIKAFLVSIENPFDQPKGAPSTDEVLEKIKRYHCDEVNVLPAIMVVKNDSFKNLFKICNYIYSKIGHLPSFSELTYHAYQAPTSSELNDLYINVKKIAKTYYGKEAIRFFPYVSPELYANNQKNYLSELDLENSIGINENNISEVAENLFQKLEKSYIVNPCSDKTCEWYDDCRLIKWLWGFVYDNSQLSVSEKLKSFCQFKKNIK